MRSQLDDLLEELDGAFEPSTQPPKAKSPFPNKALEELDDLLEPLEDSETPQQKPVLRQVQKPTRVEKCYPLCIGGTDIASGLTIGSSRLKSCDKLRCTSCDLPIKRFPDSQWSEDCNYLFFRNNYSKEQNLRTKLSFQRNNVAYNCQCTWRSASQATILNHDSWVCGGH